MKNERSIVLQKNMVLVLSFVIMAVFSTLYVSRPKEITPVNYKELAKNVSLVTCVKVEPDEKITEKNIKFLMSQSNEEEITVENDVIEETVQDELKQVETKEDIQPQVMENKETINNIEHSKQEDVLFEEEIQEDTNINSNEKVGEYKNIIEVTATAYCLCEKCCGKTPSSPDYGYTASGLKIVPGNNMKVIAVDPSVIPLNTHVYVEGLNGAWDYGFAIAADTGGAIKNNIIDLYMDSHESALSWGRRSVKLYILD